MKLMKILMMIISLLSIDCFLKDTFNQEKILLFSQSYNQDDQSDSLIFDDIVDNQSNNKLRKLNSDDKITFHIISHSHQDSGWLAPFEEYYITFVDKIFTQVTLALLKDTKRKFVISEIGFFSKWYQIQGPNTKRAIKQLISKGIIEFVNGGWVGPDEACPSYEELAINLQLGNDFLMKEFGYQVKYGWQMDAFGHSSAYTQLLFDNGMKALFIGRMNQTLKNEMKQKQMMQFNWRPKFQEDSGDTYYSDDGLFTHTLYDMYTPPCDLNIIQPTKLSDINQLLNQQLNNITKNISHYEQCLLDIADAYGQRNILLPFGDDFAYFKAIETFEFIEKFTNIMSSHNKRFEFKYSTLDEFYTDIQDEIKALPNFDTDLFPLLNKFPDHYWSGYYTSRPNFKYQIRQFSTRIQSLEHQYIREKINSQDNNKAIDKMMQNLKEILALQIHHDTITGTSPQQVINYESIEIEKAGNQSGEMYSDILRKSIIEIYGILINELEMIPIKLNQAEQTSIQDIEDEKIIVIQNPSIFEREYIELRFINLQSEIEINVWNKEERTFEKVKFDQIDYLNHDDIQETRVTVQQRIEPLHEVVLLIKNINKSQNQYRNNVPTYSIPKKLQDYIIKNDNCNLLVDQFQDSQSSITFRYQELNKEDRLFKFEFRYYTPYHGQGQSKQSSGLYVFKTTESDSKPYPIFIDQIELTSKNSMLIRYLDENKETSTVILSLKQSLGVCMIEFDVQFAPLIDENMDATINWKEINLNNKGVFYTDSNSHYIVKRSFQDVPETSNDYKNIAPANWYPIDQMIMIESQMQDKQMIVFNDRPQGGSGFRQGRIELMFNRRITSHDSLGIFEGVQEYQGEDHKWLIRTHHTYNVVFLTSRETAFKTIHEYTQMNRNQLQYFYGQSYEISEGPQNYLNLSKYRKEFIEYLKSCNAIDFNLQYNHGINQYLIQLLMYTQENINVNEQTLAKLVCRYLKQNEDQCGDYKLELVNEIGSKVTTADNMKRRDLKSFTYSILIQ